MFEFHLSVTKESVFRSPTPAPPETAVGSQENRASCDVYFCYFLQQTLSQNPSFFSQTLLLPSLLLRALQWQLCSRDVDPGKCVNVELQHQQGSFYHLKQVSPIPWSMTWAWARRYHASEVNEGGAERTVSNLPRWASSGVWKHLAPREWQYRDESWLCPAATQYRPWIISGVLLPDAFTKQIRCIWTYRTRVKKQ